MNLLLADASRFVASLKQHPRFLDQAIRACVPGLADFGLVYLVERDALHCGAAAHTTRTGARLLRNLNRIYKLRRNDLDSTVAQVVRIGRPALRRRIRPEETPTDPSAAPVFELHRRLGAHSALVVPIHGRDRVLGALALAYAESRRQYSRDDVPVAEHIALQIGFALDREVLTKAGATPSFLAQRRLLPARLRARA